MPMPTNTNDLFDPNRWTNYVGHVGGSTYGGTYGPTNPAFPPTATAPPTYPGLNPAITGLLTPGLVPDIARQSAEVSAGRGVGGSPAAASTAVRMSEQDYLQRLGLANTLMTGEAGRLLPYQITPYQSAGLQTTRDIAGQRYAGGGVDYPGGGGGGRAGSPTANFMAGPWGAPADQPAIGSRPVDAVLPNWTPAWKPPAGVGYGGGMGLDDMKNSLIGEEGVDSLTGVPWDSATGNDTGGGYPYLEGGMFPPQFGDGLGD